MVLDNRIPLPSDRTCPVQVPPVMDSAGDTQQVMLALDEQTRLGDSLSHGEPRGLQSPLVLLGGSLHSFCVSPLPPQILTLSRHFWGLQRDRVQAATRLSGWAQPRQLEKQI